MVKKTKIEEEFEAMPKLRLGEGMARVISETIDIAGTARKGGLIRSLLRLPFEIIEDR
jgi:hypothetical protein